MDLFLPLTTGSTCKAVGPVPPERVTWHLGPVHNPKGWGRGRRISGFGRNLQAHHVPELDKGPAEPPPLPGTFPAAHSPCSSPRQQLEPASTFIIITLIFKLLSGRLVLFSKPETILKLLRRVVCNFWALCMGWIGFFSNKIKAQQILQESLVVF